MKDKISDRLKARDQSLLPRDVAGHTIAAEDFAEDDDYTEEVLENDARMIKFLSSRKRNDNAPQAESSE